MEGYKERTGRQEYRDSKFSFNTPSLKPQKEDNEEDDKKERDDDIPQYPTIIYFNKGITYLSDFSALIKEYDFNEELLKEENSKKREKKDNSKTSDEVLNDVREKIKHLFNN